LLQDAGSAEAFKKVDQEYVAASAELAKASGAKYYGLVSAQGANPNVWASDLKPFHGLLYTRTKGLVSAQK
jgi:oxidoreductase